LLTAVIKSPRFLNRFVKVQPDPRPHPARLFRRGLIRLGSIMHKDACVGFPRPAPARRRERQRRKLALIASAALALSTLVAASAISIGIARAEPPGAAAAHSH